MESLGGDIVGSGDDSVYAFKDNGSQVLAVCHLDSVHPCQWFAYDRGVVFTSVLDDRLGAYAVLDYLSQIKDIQYDILLTTGEEKASSTGKHFKTSKQYNWLVEFDRRGSDVVVYDYGSHDFESLLAKYFIVGNGSFSDIAGMEFLKCKAFNVGIGYHDEHSVNSYCRLDEFRTQMARFIRFYHDLKDTYLPHTERKAVSYSGYGYGMYEAAYAAAWAGYGGGGRQQRASLPLPATSMAANKDGNSCRPSKVIPNNHNEWNTFHKRFMDLPECIAVLEQNIEAARKAQRFQFVYIPWLSACISQSEAEQLLKDKKAMLLSVSSKVVVGNSPPNNGNPANFIHIPGLGSYAKNHPIVQIARLIGLTPGVKDCPSTQMKVNDVWVTNKELTAIAEYLKYENEVESHDDDEEVNDNKEYELIVCRYCELSFASAQAFACEHDGFVKDICPECGMPFTDIVDTYDGSTELAVCGYGKCLSPCRHGYVHPYSRECVEKSCSVVCYAYESSQSLSKEVMCRH